jgi:DNA polymerase I
MALKRLLGAMLPGVDLPRALVRGRYMAAAAAMEHNGIPIDQQTLALLREHWEDIQDDLIASVDMDYGVYDGRTFKADRWEQFLVRHNIPWPRTEKGALSLADDTFRQMAKAYPEVSPIRELRSALSELRLADLAVGSDGRNRTILSAFRSRTSRNQPSSSKYIFGNAVRLRGLIKPQLGYGIAYIDYSQQEFGIAAALSGDPAMQAAYLSGDPYLAFAKQAGAVPPDATKETHGPTRELFKTCALGVLYGMAEAALATRIGQPVIVARDLLRAHRETYRRFWGWSDAVVDYAMLTGALHTSLGWHIHVGGNVNPRSLRNFPMQANGAEILRLACCLATESGIEVCGPVHDALLICAPLEELEAETASIQAIMTEAGRVVLKGFELRTDATSVRYPNRYMDKRGEVFWGKVMSIVARRQQMQAVA